MFIKGFLVGFFLCAPMGPIGLFCIRKSLMEGRMAGLAAFLGASTVDGLFCGIAGLGTAYIVDFLRQEQIFVKLGGGLILVLLGLRLFLARPKEKAFKVRGRGVLGAFASTFFLMLANPLPILIFTATFTALGLHGWKGAYVSTAALVAGVLTGSALWAPILVTVVSLFRPQFTPRLLLLANRAIGAIIFGFGMVVWLTTLLG